jgi:hypothetical protein
MELSDVSIYGSANVELEEISSPDISLTIFGQGRISAETIEANRTSIHLYGMGAIEIESLYAERLAVEIPGFGDVELAGEVEEQSISIPGSGEYRAGDLRSSVAYVRIHGSGDATVWVTDYLNGKVSGSGGLDYYGDPEIDISEGGIGRIDNLGMH